MTLTSVFGDCYIPNMLTGVPSFGTSTLDAAGEYVAYIFKIPKTGTLKKVAVKFGTVTTADPVLVSLETVDDTTGYPTGTLYTANANGTIDTPTTGTITYVPINGTSGISVTKNDIVALKITLDYTDGNLVVSTYISNSEASSIFPYMVTYVGGSYLKIAVASLLTTLEYDGEIVVAPGVLTTLSITAASFNTGSTPNQIGIKITLPFSLRAIGAYIHCDIDNPADLILYNADGITALQTLTMPDKDIRQTTFSGYYKLYFDTPQTLNKDSTYRLVLKPTTSSSVSMTNITFTDDGSLLGIDQMPIGQNACYTYCTGTPDELTDWTNDTTIRPMMGLIYNQIDIPAASGGLANSVIGSNIVRKA